MSERRRVSILGATGSIGQSTIEILLENNTDTYRYETVSLSARQNHVKLAESAIALKAEYVAIEDESKYPELKALLSGHKIEIGVGDVGLLEAARRDTDVVVSAITGAAALKPTLEAIRRGFLIALANKESIVCAGELLLNEAKRSGSTIVPVDSEHNAIFQVLEDKTKVEKLILTASGGPFRNSPISVLRTATPDQALAHPNWSMGHKISIDSATMMNKALELIEASYLFGMPEDKIDVVVHPQSIIHSMVSYTDGSVLAQLGSPDMRTPISYAIAWPERMKVEGVDRLDLAQIACLEFEEPDLDRFPAISLARKALNLGAWAPNVLNAGNEVFVDSFLKSKIGFMDITKLVSDLLDSFLHGEYGVIQSPQNFDDVYALDSLARRKAATLLK